MSKEIYVDVPASHKDPIVIGVNGERGEGCKELTRRLEAAFGSVINDVDTSEMHERPIDVLVKEKAQY